MQSSVIISVQHVSRVYRHGGEVVHANRDISIDIATGTLTMFQGKSGSGKTTLINLMSGLEQPDSGRILYDGRDFATFANREMTQWRRHQAAFVFQSFALLPGLSALENIDIAARIAGCGPREAKTRAEHYLETFGLAGRATHRVSELSGGEQQRVAVARGLVTQPRILFADEPTGELDHAMSRRIMATLRAVVQEQGTTICLTSHDPSVRDFADLVCTLADGAITALDRPAPPAAAEDALSNRATATAAAGAIPGGSR